MGDVLMKKYIALALCLILIISAIPLCVSAEETTPAPNPDAYPDYCDLEYGALYAHATAGGSSSQTWQRWHKDILGFNAEEDVRYFFLPKTADDNYLEIYNNYDDGAVTIGDVTIEPYTSAIIDYKEGEKIIATRNKGTAYEKKYTFMVLKSDAEASVYVNDTVGSYKDYSGAIKNTDLWSFLIQNKENSVSDSKCSIVDENGVLDTTLKKIKGRGNTNWKETDKKPFNLTFYDKTTIGNTTDKKFSFVSNAKDSTLIRNSVMYDFAFNVDSLYSPDQSFVDFFVNGVYRGSYIACQKIDLGKNSVVSLKDESDDMDEGFNFLVEVDVWNYSSDVYFVTEQGYHVVLKTPDLDDYDETDPSMKSKYDYISSTYQKLENALYNGSLSDIEKICDLESLATQYLLQEFGKNCDGGYTSTFFTYNASENKFYAAPIWDCDSCLGAVNCTREGCTTSTVDHTGWITRTAIYNDTINPLGQAFYVEGTSSEGKNFNDICCEIWSEKFVPQIDILLGKAEPEGRLKSLDSYSNSIEKSAFINYTMWDFMWRCAANNSSLNKEYTKDFEGEVEYLKDWVAARAQWMSKYYDLNAEPVTNTIYFATNENWENVNYYVWGDGYVPMKWPGTPATETEASYDECTVYKAEIPADVTMVIFNNGLNGAQTVNITLNDFTNLYYTTTSTGRQNEAGFDIFNIESGYFIEPEQPTEAPSTTTEPVETTSEPSSSTDFTNTTPSVSDTVVVSDPTEATSESTETTFTDPTEITTSAESSSIDTEPTIQDSVSTSTDVINTSIDINEPSYSRETTTSDNNISTESTDAPAAIATGDADCDGRISIKDATIIQKYLAKLVDLDETAKKAADTTFDDKITVSDATKIQKFIAELIEKF